LLQQVLSPGWNHHFHTKGVGPGCVSQDGVTQRETLSSDASLKKALPGP
jgi:hypothetical protein